MRLSPLLDRHHLLTEASVKRKIALLRESVAATLETLNSKIGRSRTADFDSAAAQLLLDGADDVMRRVRERASTWWEGRRSFSARAFHRVAEDVISAQRPDAAGCCCESIERSLARQGRDARALVTELQEFLVETLERLSELGGLVRADSSAIRSLHSGGLPAINLDELNHSFGQRPWWSHFAPSLAVRVIESSIREHSGRAVTDALETYDRHVESWLKSKIARSIELYEAQAGPIREQMRRLATRSEDGPMTADVAALNADLAELRSDGGDNHVEPGYLDIGGAHKS
jgi:hypothetical protein